MCNYTKLILPALGWLVGVLPTALNSYAQSVEEKAGVIRVRTDYFEVTHPQVGRGGLPQAVKFVGSGREDAELFLFDRVYQNPTKRMLRKDFFAEGRLLGEVANELENPPFKTVWKVRGRAVENTLPSVYVFLWENPKGQRLLALGNVSTSPRAFRATVPGYAPVACELAPGEVRLVDLIKK